MQPPLTLIFRQDQYAITMADVNDSKPSSTKNTPPVVTPTRNTAPSSAPNTPREATRESLAKHREWLKTADLSKVKVW